MPKVAAEGTPHASFTDHYIRVVDEDGSETEETEAADGPVTMSPYFDEDAVNDVYAGMAYVIYGRQQADTTAMQRGTALLAELLGDEPVAADSARGEALFLLGFARMQLGDVAGAIAPLERSVTADPGIPERLNALAQAYESDGRSAESVERLYARALAIQPALATVRVNYGRHFEARQQLGRAIEQYRQAVDERPWLETAHFNLGTAYLRDGDMQAGEDALREAVRLDPDYGEALSNLGLLMAGQGRETEAVTFFTRAVDAEPSNPITLGNLGAFYLNSGNLDGAIDLLSRAVAQDPGYVDGMVNLALAYFRQEEYGPAQTYAERALQIAPGNQLARQILNAL